MSSVVENQTLLSGRVVSRAPHPSVERWDELRLVVSNAEDVGAEPNLLRESVGRQVSVAVNRDELPAGDLAAWRFTGRVRMAGPEVVVAVPSAAGGGPPTLRAPTGEPAEPSSTDQPGGGVPPPSGTWPEGTDGPRPEL